MQTFAHLDGLSTDKTRAIREIITLPDGLKPGVDVFTPDFAAAMVNIGAINPQPVVGWTTTDGGKIFAAPVVPPAGPIVRSVQGAVLVHTLDKATKVTARDLAYVGGLISAREDMASIARIAAIDGLTAKSWFDAALGVTA